MASKVLDQVRQALERYALPVEGETLVVGVSGGPDSLCLLHVLCGLSGEYGFTVHVAHLHHGVRGADADADAAFVRALAADWRVACTVEWADVPSLAQEHRLAIEEAARRARYAFLGRVAVSAGARTIAVGHNADDQTETVLMHYLRGAGLAGLRGMLPSTPLEDYRLFEIRSGRGRRGMRQGAGGTARSPNSSLQLIRPLLEVTRADIEAYCETHALVPRFDRSNLDTTYFRNWLRHQVIPLLSRHNPNVREVVRRSARVIADDYALLRSLLEETWPRIVLEEFLPDSPHQAVGADGRAGSGIVFDLAAWRALPTALQRSTLREAIHRLRRSLRNINFLHVENALLVARDGATGDQATLPRGLMLLVGYDRFTIAPESAAEFYPNWPLLPPEAEPLTVLIPGGTPLPDSEWVLRSEALDRSGLPSDWKANPDPWRAFLDAEAVGPTPLLRSRLDGDRFQPLGMDGHTVKLADFLTNQKVPRGARDGLPLLVGKPGILWVCGWRVDERARIRESTRQALVLQFVRQ